jgi:hypothetical protein
MPRRFTASSLVERIKKACDKENDEQISDSEWKSLMSEVYGLDLYSEVALTGYRYFEYTVDVTATGADSYDEEADVLTTVSICRVIDDSGTLSPPLIELAHQEEPYLAGLTGNASAYQHIDDLLYLYPNPSSGTYRWRYIPQPPDLGTYADSDVVDVVCPAGESLLIWGTAALGLSKSESDVRFALSRMEKAREALQVWCANRSMDGRHRPINLDGALDPWDWRNR